MKQLIDRPVIVVGGITIVGAILRLFHLGFKPLWLDEAVLYWISNSGNLSHIVSENALRNSTPPLFAILLHLFLRMGDSEFILRLLPWFGGVAAIPAIYFLSRQYAGMAPAYFSTLVVAITSTQVQYSQQLREYSLTFFLATMILGLFCQVVRQPTSKSVSLMTAAMVLGIFLQYGVALLLVSLNLLIAFELVLGKTTRKRLVEGWVVSQSLVLCAVLAVYFLSLKQQWRLGFGATSTSNYLTSGYGDGSLPSMFHLAVFNTLDILGFAYTGSVSLLVFLLIIGFVVTLRRTSPPISGYRSPLMLTIPLLVTFAAANARIYPYLGARQDIFLLPMLYVLVGFGFGYVLEIIAKKWVVLLFLLLIVGGAMQVTLRYLRAPGQEDLRPVVSALSASFVPGDTIYVYYAAQPAFTYYYRQHFDSQFYGISSRANPSMYFKEIDELLMTNNRVWMVFSACYADECQLIPEHISQVRSIQLIASGTDTWLYLVP